MTLLPTPSHPFCTCSYDLNEKTTYGAVKSLKPCTFHEIWRNVEVAASKITCATCNNRRLVPASADPDENSQVACPTCSATDESEPEPEKAPSALDEVFDQLGVLRAKIDLHHEFLQRWVSSGHAGLEAKALWSEFEADYDPAKSDPAEPDQVVKHARVLLSHLSVDDGTCLVCDRAEGLHKATCAVWLLEVALDSITGPHRPCGCGMPSDVHAFGSPGCEYHDHHCDNCHERGNCTSLSCST